MITEREMDAFRKASAGVENTRLANVMIIEHAMYVQDGLKERSAYIEKHSTLKGGPAEFKTAKAGWAAHLEEFGEEKELQLLERYRRIADSNEGQLTLLMADPVKGMRKAFYEASGWLPRGMKRNPKWKFEGESGG